MEIKGKITKILDLQTGEGRNGTWKKQEYIIEKEGQYPKNVNFAVWGDKIDQFNLQEGETVILSIDIESREFNGRWYTNVQAWKAMRPEQQVDEMNQEPPIPVEEPDFSVDNSEDDLPF